MENRGVLLYVDLGRLEDEPYRLSKIYDTLGQYIDDIRRQRDIIYISKMAESLDISQYLRTGYVNREHWVLVLPREGMVMDPDRTLKRYHVENGDKLILM